MRDTVLTQATRIVIKIGSSLIASRAEGLRPDRIERLADEIATLKKQGREILIVSSGAIVSGIKKLQLKEYPKNLPVKQAAAAVGQTRLMWAYEKAFEHLSIQVAQILLTHQDLEDRRRFLNARHTLATLIDFGIIPIINENDTVAVDEIRVGDNDTLASEVAHLADADLLVILSDVDGLYTEDPRKNPSATLIPPVDPAAQVKGSRLVLDVQDIRPVLVQPAPHLSPTAPTPTGYYRMNSEIGEWRMEIGNSLVRSQNIHMSPNSAKYLARCAV